LTYSCVHITVSEHFKQFSEHIMSVRTLASVVVSSFLSFTALSATAGTVTGGSLLSATDADQLETWLGSGDLDFTNIWSGVAGVATASSFHAAVDGAGPTFSLFGITNGNGTNAIIGGYTQEDWSGDAYKTDLTAFIFNLTSGEIQNVEAASADRAIRTAPHFFPTFGNGHDIFAGVTILGTNSGGLDVYSDGYSYSQGYDVSQGQITVVGDSGGASGDSGTLEHHWSVNSLEVYTFAPAALPPAPVPAGVPLMAGALGLLAWMRRRSAS
jgi:hypothetical protein